MTGELIPTGVTFGVGRNSINNAFSGTAYMNNIELDSGGNFSAGTGGGVIYSAGTDLYSIFLTTADGNDITRVQPGTNITTGGTANNPTINLADSPSLNGLILSGSAQLNIATATSLSSTTISGETIFSGSTPLQTILNNIISGVSSNSLWTAGTPHHSIIGGSGNTISGSSSLSFIFSEKSSIDSAAENSIILGGSGHSIGALAYSSIIGGVSNKMEYLGGPPINEYANAIIGGRFNNVTTLGVNSVIIGGSENSLGGANSVIIGGSGNLLGGFNSVILGGNNLTINDDNVAAMMNAYIDGYIDLNPQSTLPFPSVGRIFFSGSPLFKLMINTGGTTADWTLV